LKIASAIAYSTMFFYTPSAMIRYLKLPATWNRGIAFSPFASTPYWAIMAGMIFLGYMTYIALERGNKITRWGIILLWGGALSNIMDRLVHGAVMDYIPIPLWPGGLYINAADIGLMAGAIVVFISFSGLYTNSSR